MEAQENDEGFQPETHEMPDALMPPAFPHPIPEFPGQPGDE